MERILTLKQLAAACGGELVNCDGDITAADVVTDSRKAAEGTVFVALRGEKFDGHNFVAHTFESGAVCCVVDKAFDNAKGYSVIVVDDTYKALRDIAAFYRSRFHIPSVAITGSVGKTSTKDMVSCVLGARYNVLKTEGNFNNEIGLPLTAFRLDNSHELAVFEMGMSAFGEISRLTRIAAPETAILTNIGFSHIEHLGSQENILKAKLEVLEGMPEDGTVILNGDDPYLRGAVETVPCETLTYGIESKDCDITATNIEKSHNGTAFEVKVDGQVYKAKINAPGVHHVYNALAAILAGIKYGMTMEDIIRGIGEFHPLGLRQNIEELSRYVLIKDCYNASPTSMKSGLEVLSVTLPKDKSAASRKVAILGDMLELGKFSDEAHIEVGRLAAQYGPECLIAVGPHSKKIAEGAIDNGFNSSEIYVFYDNNTAMEHIMDILQPNDVILLKASRGMCLEQIAEFIAERDSE